MMVVVIITAVMAIVTGCIALLLGIIAPVFGLDPSTGQLIAAAALVLILKTNFKVDKSS